MAVPERNQHHNVPGSRGGTSQGCNLSKVLYRRHVSYHDWAWNRDPAMLVRLFGVHAIGVEGRSLPPSALEDLLHAARREDWRELYVPEATMDVPKRSDRTQWRKANHYLAEHTEQEILWVRRTIGALNFDQKYPVQWCSLLRGGLRFFAAKSPREAIGSLLCESHAGELTWVKAMESTVRAEILGITRKAQEEPLSVKDRETFVDILISHEQFLLHSILANEHGEIMGEKKERGEQ